MAKWQRLTLQQVLSYVLVKTMKKIIWKKIIVILPSSHQI